MSAASQHGEQAKALLGKMSDLTKCQTAFDAKVGKLAASASARNVACRYLSNGDDSVTDTETGLMWRISVDDLTWVEAMGSEISSCDGYSSNGTNMFPVCSVYSDWRVPNIVELKSILDLNAPGCNLGGPCIDPVFVSAPGDAYWSSSTSSLGDTDLKWIVNFFNGVSGPYNATLGATFHTRVVRSAL